MSLTKKEEELIMLRAEKLVYEVVTGVMKNHIKSCPHGQRMTRWIFGSKVGVVALIFGIGLASGGGALAALSLFGKL